MSRKFTSDRPSIEEIMRLKNKHTTSIDILVDAQLASRIKELERSHMIELRIDDKQNRTPLAPGILKEIEELTDQALKSTVTFTFQDLGRKRFEDSWKQFPPTDEQREQGHEWDPDKFGPAIISMACIDPKMTLKEAQELYDEWSTAETELLFMTAINANLGVSSIPLSATAIGGQPNSDLSLITALKEASPSQDT